MVNREYSVDVTLERDVYYDNEEVRGNVAITALRRYVKLHNLMIVLWARLVVIDDGVSGEMVSLHISKRPTTEYFIVDAGSTENIPFIFTIPPGTPASIYSKHGIIQWRVAAVYEKDAKTVSAIGSKIFRKASLYHSLQTFFPTSQNEKRLGSGNLLRVEASLSKDVYAIDEAIEISLTIHENKTTKLPAIKGVNVRLFQHCFARKGARIVMKPTKSKLAKLKEKIDAFRIVHLEHGGCVAEKAVHLICELADQQFPKFAYQIIQRSNPKEDVPRINGFAPTVKYFNEDKEVVVKYEVEVEVLLPDGNDITLSLPFTMQNQRSEALRITQEDEVELSLKLPVFAALDDDLPAYDDVQHLSLPTYTSLRRASVDINMMYSAARLLSLSNNVVDEDSKILDDGLCSRNNSRARSMTMTTTSLTNVSESITRRSLNSLSSTTFRTGVTSPSFRSSTESLSCVDQSVRSRRKSAAAIILTENNLAATANRTFRRMRRNSFFHKLGFVLL